MRKQGALVVGLAVVALATAAQAAGTRIGFVDVQRVLVKSVAGLAAREQLEKEKATMQKDVDSRRTEVDKLRDELEKKGLVLSADAKREKEEALQRRAAHRGRLSANSRLRSASTAAAGSPAFRPAVSRSEAACWKGM